MNSNNWNTWRTYLEELADPQSVDTSTLLSKTSLSEDIWTKNEQLKPEILQAALRIAQEYFQDLELDPNIKIKDITLTGSLASYNWSDMSDFDLHILIDFNELTNRDLLEDYLRQKSRIWNITHKILLKGYEVEIYVQDTNEPHYTAGEYSLMNNRWNKRPFLGKMNIDYQTVKQKAAKIMDEIDDAYDLFAEKDFLEAKEAGDAIMERLRRYRKAGLESGGIYSIENLVFKVLRRNNYLEKLSNVRTNSYDSLMGVNQ
ncbi:MAG TPA: hypothetical protein DHV30_17215 [Balneola sp.]|nr:hypothetical protein [Balneola sp.]|tara:strand:+ start:309 stop:1085 length:777 start_codon:yes stop_codon:yes gene_type:complete